MSSRPRRLLVPLAIALILAFVTSGAPGASATLQPTSLSASFSTTSPAYNRPVTITGNVSPWGAPTGGGRTVYLRTYMNGNWINVRSLKLTGSAYSISYQTTWLGTRKYQVWTPNTSRQAGAWSQQVTVNHHQYASATTSSLAPSPADVGTNVVMRGRVSSAGTVSGRTVTLYRLFPNGHRRAERTTKTTTDGSWYFTLPHWFLTSTDVRASVAGTASTAATSSDPRRQTMRPTYDPAGYARQHSWLRDPDGLRWRWNGCRKEITYRVNSGGLGPGFLDEVKVVARRVQQASGIHFRYLGATTAIPGSQRTWPGDTNLVIAYAYDKDTSWDLSTKIGRGGPTYGYKAKDFSGTMYETVKAGVVLKKGYSWTGGFSGTHSRGQALMHEAGHAMGLGHVDVQSQVMYPSAVDHPRYGAGDLFGLERAGYGLGGCTTRLLARPVIETPDPPNEG